MTAPSAIGPDANKLRRPVLDRPRGRRVLETLPGIERDVVALEGAAERLGGAAEELATTVDGLGDDPQEFGTVLRVLAGLRREAATAQVAGGALAERIGEVRSTLAQLDEAGVMDAAEDDEALEELGDRVTSSVDLLGSIVDLIDASAEEVAEMRAAVGSVRDDF